MDDKRFAQHMKSLPELGDAFDLMIDPGEKVGQSEHCPPVSRPQKMAGDWPVARSAK